MNPPPPGFQLKPLRLSDLLDTVFGLYARNLLLVVLVVGVLQVPFQLLSDLIRLALPKAPTALLKRAARHHLLAVQWHAVVSWIVPELGISLLLLLVGLLVVFPLQEAALTKVVADRHLDQSTSLGSAYRFALGRWPSLIGLIVLVSALYVVALLVLAVVAVLLHAALGTLGSLLDFLLVLAAVVTAVGVSIRLSLSVPVLVIERSSPWPAVQRSWELTRGGAWRAFGVILVLFVVEIIAGLILDLLVALLGSLGGGTGHPLGAVLFDLGSVISSILVAPIILVGLVLLYFDFRVRKEEFTSDQLSAHLAS
ncbi:MAG: glycerophosphoryl diester phosphodiesterase membrane domain-containing protein [Candidatus Dormibacteria bacterium]|jgi:hypothetical protein